MMKQYNHTQVGYFTAVPLGTAILLIVFVMIASGFNWIALIVLMILAICLGLFATLTVRIDDKALQVRFGRGLIHKTIELDQVAAYRVVKNPWYYGWGIRLIPEGWLFNVSGFWAVELQLKSGKRYRIGTDDPEGLKAAIEAAVSRLNG